MRARRCQLDDLRSGSQQDTDLNGESLRPQSCTNGLCVVKSGAFSRSWSRSFFATSLLCPRGGSKRPGSPKVRLWEAWPYRTGAHGVAPSRSEIEADTTS